jgi:3-dehydroquinate dehydratase-2
MTKSKPKKKSSKWRILVASGANLDLLGTREPEIYGSTSLAEIHDALHSWAKDRDIELTCRQTNDEGEYMRWLGEGWDGLVLNPGAWTHTSLALADRVAGLRIPCVEVHLSQTAARESFRHVSWIAAKSVGSVSGFGPMSYRLGLEGLLSSLNEPNRKHI